MLRKTRSIFIASLISAACLLGLAAVVPTARAADREFSLQISPSPLVLTLKPGQETTVDLKVRNTGTTREDLKIAPRSFKVNKQEALEFDDTKPPETASWVKFNSPHFSVEPGQVFDQKITFTVPKDAGFSYSFALVINRQKMETDPTAGRQLKGSVALFTLLNIDRPGAKRELQITDFKPTQSLYEYLPAKFDITFKNTGNTIVQPVGNVFIQRGSNDEKPIGTLKVNEANGYILPGTTRTLQAQWTDGFQVIKTVTASDGTTKEELTWNWNNLSKIPFGPYTAKAVAIYNDGQRDIPVMSETGFWVIPWKLLVGLLVILVLIGWGLWSFVKTMTRFKKKKRIRF